mmetsp:Transcript_37710/g.103627  ORF Transcript_37710/g.103627 Transcript_37710/m.103627 type:complete len:228 (+) Transcript_37710:641-1324(+)
MLPNATALVDPPAACRSHAWSSVLRGGDCLSAYPCPLRAGDARCSRLTKCIASAGRNPRPRCCNTCCKRVERDGRRATDCWVAERCRGRCMCNAVCRGNHRCVAACSPSTQWEASAARSSSMDAQRLGALCDCLRPTCSFQGGQKPLLRHAAVDGHNIGHSGVRWTSGSLGFVDAALIHARALEPGGAIVVACAPGGCTARWRPRTPTSQRDAAASGLAFPARGTGS